MASYHILHWIPDPRLRILHGYQEVIETLVWGLLALGHEATTAVNYLRDGATPIVLGAQLMHPVTLAGLPPDAIIYNLEQLQGLRATGRDLSSFAEAVQGRTVWDYSIHNILEWRALGVSHALHVPIGFAPTLVRIPRAAEQDIDVLFYGTPSESRAQAISALCALGLTTMFFYGLYGAARDALIARSKLLVSITFNTQSAIFPIVRASYMLANRKAFVSDLAAVERDIYPGVAFATRDALPELCLHLARNDEARRRLEEAGYAAITGRDIRAVLISALQSSKRGIEVLAAA
jgi:hypothetical protein